MSFGGLILTNAGRNELIKAEMGERMNITHIVLGEGVYNGSYTAINNLVEEVMRIPVTSISRTDEGILVECDFNSLDAPRAFYLREIGIIANGVLCYYDNSRDNEEYIDPTSETLIKQKRMRLLLLISSAVEVNVGIVSSLYALAEDLEKILYPEYTEAVNLETLEEKENIWIILGKIKRAIRELIVHLEDTNNPHGVTPELLGVEAGANNYTHPATHSAEIIVQDSTHRFVSDLQMQAWDGTYEQATGYVDQQIENLINGAPNTLDTLGEIAKAMQDNADVVTALEAAIGGKAANNHLHDDRYYTETEVDNKLAGKANSSHTHDDRYYTETEVDNKLAGKANSSHTHDDRYYTETEVDNKLAGKANSNHAHDDEYLSIYGGDLKGSLLIPKGYAFNLGTGAHLMSISGQNLRLAASLENDFMVYLGVFESGWRFKSATDGTVTLGSPSHKWGQIFSTVTSISTSDKNLKKDITKLPDKYIALFNLLQPVSYRFIDGTSGRIHIGFISQDVENAMKQVGLSDLEFAGFCKDKKYVMDPHTGKESLVQDEDGNPVYIYSLRYEEFIALNTAVIQSQQQQIQLLEERLEKLEKFVELL